MGQPIYLQRGEEKTVVYGPNQAQVLLAQGWMPDDKAAAEGAIVVSATNLAVDDLTLIKGVGAAVAAVLADAGYRRYASVATAPPEDLIALDRISSKTVQSIQESAASLAAE